MKRLYIQIKNVKSNTVVYTNGVMKACIPTLLQSPHQSEHQTYTFLIPVLAGEAIF